MIAVPGRLLEFFRPGRRPAAAKADGAEAQPYRRRLLSGRTVPAALTGRTWQDLVAPGPKALGLASHLRSHPSHKHNGGPERSWVLTPPGDVQGPVAGQPSRRERRAAQRRRP